MLLELLLHSTWLSYSATLNGGAGLEDALEKRGKGAIVPTILEKIVVLIMKPLDSMDLVTFIVGYQKLWKKQPAKLKILGDTKEPLAPLTDNGKMKTSGFPFFLLTYLVYVLFVTK